MKTLVLFDMDGTLTPARKSVTKDITASLTHLQNHATVGIVSGSPMNYINQQMSSSWLEGNVNSDTLLFYPCNGTQEYSVISEDNFTPCRISHVDMIDEMGKENYRILVSILTDLQNFAIETTKDMPVSGNFVSFRESMVNWCMIGRDASNDMRKKFEDIEKSYSIRKNLKRMLDSNLKTANIDNIHTALGGSTSIDIFPVGWDKTYCLNHVRKQNFDRVYFVGDKCQPGQNDREIYVHPETISFESSGPSNTIEIIRSIIEDL